MEGPSVHSRCLAFIPFKFWEEEEGGGEDFFSFFFGSQCVPQHNITMCSFSFPPIKTPRTPPPPTSFFFKQGFSSIFISFIFSYFLLFIWFLHFWKKNSFKIILLCFPFLVSFVSIPFVQFYSFYFFLVYVCFMFLFFLFLFCLSSFQSIFMYLFIYLFSFFFLKKILVL